MNELQNMTSSGNYPDFLNSAKVSFSSGQLDSLINILSASLEDLKRRKEYLIKNNKPFDFLSRKAQTVRELFSIIDSARYQLNSARADYLAETLDKGVNYHE